MKSRGKKKLIIQGIVACVLVAVALSAGLGALGFDTVFGEGKKLPIYSVQTEEKKIAISFDAAWGNEHTIPILDILDQYGVKTTFFLVEFWVDEFPEDVKEIYNRGHEFGNHSATHPNMAEISKEEIISELKRPEEKIQELTGVQTKVFRPPFGAYSNTLIETAEANGYKVIQWDVDSLDWKDISAEQIVDRVTRNVKPGSIVLFHNNAQHVQTYLPLILEKLQADGYSIVPVGELILWENYRMDHTGKQIPN
jgi:polysaccharide deacetylase family sporulation protein PdaB